VYFSRIIVGVLIVGLSLFSIPINANQNPDSLPIAIFSIDPVFSALSQSKARKLYRGKTKRLDGKRVELADWPEHSAERVSFYHALLSKNPAQMNAHWASLSFSGKARPPKEIANADIETLLAWMSEKSHRIGYAPLNQLPDNANILYVVSREK
jgi:hypothetical protein